MSGDHPPRLVFGDDGSPAADVAWLWINSHRWNGWHLEVVTATGLIDLAEPDEARRHESYPALRRPFAEAAFVEVTRQRPKSDPRLALARRSDLIVIGRRGPGLLKALHLGSTAEWMLVRPPAPTCIIRHGRPTHRVLVAHDGSPHAQAATDALARLPFARDLDISVTVVDPGVPNPTHPPADVADAVVQRLARVGVGATAQVLRGDPTIVLGGLVESTRPDLLVLGTAGHLGMQRARLGSTAAALTHAVTCSVLVARAGSEPHEHEPAEPAGLVVD